MYLPGDRSTEYSGKGKHWRTVLYHSKEINREKDRIK